MSFGCRDGRAEPFGQRPWEGLSFECSELSQLNYDYID